jgi:hypothetical protein
MKNRKLHPKKKEKTRKDLKKQDKQRKGKRPPKKNIVMNMINVNMTLNYLT